jgi:pimeloyl-ACP methyl ester carboxylesterase
MEEKTIFVKGLKTYYKIGGKGESFLILHGWGGSSKSWEKVMKILSLKFKVICPDLPGFGKSDIPSEIWNLDDFKDWLKEFVDKLALENFFLLGHSFGGRVSIKFSISFPERVKKLFLLNSAGIKQDLTLKDKIIINLSKFGKKLISGSKFQDKISKLFYFIFGIKDYSRAQGTMKEIMKKVIEEDLLPCLSKIQTETIIIWGKEDKIVHLKYGFLFKEHIKNSKLEIIPKVGHSPHLKDPEKLVEVLISHLK